MPPDLVVFDCDGVLVDTERIQVAVEARLLTRLGWPMDDEQVVERWMGRSSAAQLADIGEHLGEKAVHRYAEGFDATPEHRATYVIELHGHEPRRELDDMHRELQILERVGCFEPE